MVATLVKTNVTDPVADLLTRLRNGNLAQNPQVIVAASKLNAAILKILQDEGYIAGFANTGGPRQGFQVEMKYGADRERVIKGLRRISKPGRRIYAKRDALPRVLGGLGVAILSTSHGVMTDRQAAKQGIGGEVLAYVW